ncbi:hypothetical protein AVEN_111986-1 [Araneus ventricosus]|uniref:Uncharacterized protein n=1 Tax=Araneus ventricosus TaxID=182803 RepID=A0A4Y2V0X9_ARAVE|nr:hypothetical protein AVEN_111986-1 [Araneus ventricosus]
MELSLIGYNEGVKTETFMKLKDLKQDTGVPEAVTAQKGTTWDKLLKNRTASHVQDIMVAPRWRVIRRGYRTGQKTRLKRLWFTILRITTTVLPAGACFKDDRS